MMLVIMITAVGTASVTVCVQPLEDKYVFHAL